MRSLAYVLLTEDSSTSFFRILNTDYECDIIQDSLFPSIFSENTFNYFIVYLSWNKNKTGLLKILNFGNLIFSEKDIFWEIYSWPVNLLGKYTFNLKLSYITDFCHRLRISYATEQLFLRTAIFVTQFSSSSFFKIHSIANSSFYTSPQYQRVFSLTFIQ